MESYLKFPEFRSPLADIIYGLCEKRVILKSRVTMDAIALTPTGLPPVFVMPEANVGWVRLGEVRPKEPSPASNIVHAVKEIPFPKEDLETLTKGNTSKDNYLSPDAQYEFKAVKTKAKSAKAVKAFLDMEGLKLNGEEIVGLKEQLEKIKAENGYLFEDETPPPQFTKGSGYNPTADGDMNAARAVMGLPPQTK